MKIIFPIKLTLLLFCSLLLYNCKVDSDEKPPNVLFLAIDDLRPELGCYGNSIIKSPNLDQLAAEGRLFKNHFVQVPTCGASRYSMLTGQRPSKKIHLSNKAISETFSGKPEEDIPETFAHQMKRNGYYTVSIGKISHHPDGIVYGYEEEAKGPKELPYSWNEIHSEVGSWGNGWKAFFAYANGKNRIDEKEQVLPYEKADVADTGYPDGLNAELAVRKLSELKNADQPFLLAVGLYKPHMPWSAPSKYWDMYDRDKIKISEFPDSPLGVNDLSLNNCGEFNNYQLGQEKAGRRVRLTDEYAKHLIHGYYASVSYADAQVGEILDELKRLNLDENTIVVVWGDHGWQLGDLAQWGKHTLFEKSLRSAFIIKTPDMNNPGNQADGIVESLDIYPTLMDLCHISYDYPLDGKSLRPILDDPNAKIKDAAYGYFRNGITMRNEQYRLTKYYREAMPNVELYNQEKDPYNANNIAEDNQEVVNNLMPVLQLGYTGIFDK